MAINHLKNRKSCPLVEEMVTMVKGYLDLFFRVATQFHSRVMN